MSDEIQISERWWSPEQVARALQVHPRTVRRWIGEGALPATKLGRLLRVADSDLHAFARRGRVHPVDSEIEA